MKFYFFILAFPGCFFWRKCALLPYFSRRNLRFGQRNKSIVPLTKKCIGFFTHTFLSGKDNVEKTSWNHCSAKRSIELVFESRSAKDFRTRSESRQVWQLEWIFSRRYIIQTEGGIVYVEFTSCSLRHTVCLSHTNNSHLS